MKTFQEILQKYRDESVSQRDKGSLFENLMLNFLKTYQVYDQRFKSVCLWRDFEFKFDVSGSGKDVGVDLVAELEDGGYWAVQCKCYKADNRIEKSSVDSFLSASGKRFALTSDSPVKFAGRLWISTTDEWSAEAENALKNQEIPCHRIGLANLENADVDWEKLDEGVFGADARKPKKTALKHQITALEKAKKHFATHDRGRMIMACGTGKTFTSLRVAEELTGGRGLTLFLAPSIALIGQTLKEWSSDAEKPFHAICVCSDREVASRRKNVRDENSTGAEDLPIEVTTDASAVQKALRYAVSVGRAGGRGSQGGP
jgi:predicted helicase